MAYRTVRTSGCAVSVTDCVDVYSALSIRCIASDVICDSGRRVRISLLQGDYPRHGRIPEWGEDCHYNLLSVMIFDL